MRIFNKENDYAIQLLCALARASKPVSLRNFSRVSGISFLFLQRIARKLRTAGIIQARHGRGGGYTLAKKPSSITLADILDAINGRGITVACLSGAGCPLEHSCGFPQRFARLDADIRALLKKKSLSAFL